MKTNRIYFPVLVAIAVMCVNACTAMAENWPRFRGPNGQGVSSAQGIPAKWSADDVAWQLDLDGIGHSSPVIWEDKIFVTFANGEATQGTLMAVGASDGEVLWRKDYALKALSMNPLNSLAASTPALDAGGVYTIWYGSDQTLVVATDSDGAQQWEKKFKPTSIRHGPGGSPMVYDDKVILSLEQTENGEGLQSFWYALDTHSGEIRWSVERNNSSHGSSSTPTVYESPSGEEWLVFSSRAHGVTGVDPETGRVVWEAGGPLPARVVASPIVARDRIVAICGQGGSGVQLSVVRPPNAGESQADVLYTLTERFVSNVPTPIAVGDWLFLFHDRGVVTCLDSRTGDVVWSEKPGGKFFGSPVLIGDRLYCVDTDGRVVVLRAGGSYERLAVNELGEGSHATPAVANGRMILRTYSRLYCIVAGGDR